MTALPKSLLLDYAATMVQDTGICRVEGYNRREIAEMLIAQARATSETKSPQPVKHLIYCSAGRYTPLGGDMCICLREIALGHADHHEMECKPAQVKTTKAQTDGEPV